MSVSRSGSWSSTIMVVLLCQQKGVLGEERLMASTICRYQTPLPCVKFYPRARSGEGKASITVSEIYPKCKGMLTFKAASLEDL